MIFLMQSKVACLGRLSCYEACDALIYSKVVRVEILWQTTESIS